MQSGRERGGDRPAASPQPPCARCLREPNFVPPSPGERRGCAAFARGRRGRRGRPAQQAASCGGTGPAVPPQPPGPARCRRSAAAQGARAALRGRCAGCGRPAGGAVRGPAPRPGARRGWVAISRGHTCAGSRVGAFGGFSPPSSSRVWLCGVHRVEARGGVLGVVRLN